MTPRRFQFSVRTLMACILVVAGACATLAALRFDLYFIPLVVVVSLLAVMLLLTRNGLLVSSVGCVLSFWLVVTGHEHVRGPICILAWYSIQHGQADPVLEFAAISILPVAAILSAYFVADDRMRATLSAIGIIGLFGAWVWLTSNSMSLGWEHLAALPLFACLIWRAAFDVRSLMSVG